MVVGGGVFTPGCRRLADLALRVRLPTIFTQREHVEDSGLMSYRTRPGLPPARRVLDKLIKGAKPADLPVEQPTRFFLTINRKTTRALGLTIRLDCFARRRVIE